MNKFIKLAIILPISALVLAGCGQQQNDSHTSRNSTKSSRPTNLSRSYYSATHHTYNVGQTVNYYGLKLRVNHVYYWNGNDIYQPDSGKKYVMANVTVTNNSRSQKDILEDSFQLNDNGANSDWDSFLDSDAPHGGRDLGDGSLDKSASKTGFLYGEANNNDKLKLKYQPNELNDNKWITIKLN